MSFKSVFAFIFIIFVILSLGFYWFYPYNSLDFGPNYGTTNFTVEGSGESQFYSNMRFPSNTITYRIDGCPLQKEDEMERAFVYLANVTSLKFTNVYDNEQIFITCENKVEVENGLFIAGEGGPTEITKTNNFNVIFKGKILLLRESQCKDPNVGLHELLHVLGFAHSTNPDNIMYPTSKCGQKIGEDTVNLLNELYFYPSLADISFENVSAQTNGRYLDSVINLRNNGLIKSKSGKIIIYADGDKVKDIDFSPIEVGEGIKVTFNNTWIVKSDIKEFKFVIDYPENELNTKDNILILNPLNKK